MTQDQTPKLDEKGNWDVAECSDQNCKSMNCKKHGKDNMLAKANELRPVPSIPSFLSKPLVRWRKP